MPNSQILTIMLPKISIITTVYNDKSGFELTASSITSQTALKEIEWIVIDAASTDGTTDIIEKYDNDISYWVSEADKGIYDGMNKGIERAKGQYTLFLNAGDTLYSIDTIEAVISQKEFGHYDYLSGNTVYTKNNKAIGASFAPQIISGTYLFKQSLGHQSTFIKTDRLKQNGGYDISYKIVADAKFFFDEIIMNSRSYKYIDLYISNYDVTGISSVRHQENFNERQRFLAELLPPRILSDYKRLVYGETSLERILCKLKEKDFLYKLITFFATLLYTPIALCNRAKMFWRRITRNRK